MEDIIKQIELARKNLLDLTMRNRLLNYRPTKRRTLRIIDEIPSEIYDILILQENVMEFLPFQIKNDSNDSKENLLFQAPKQSSTSLIENNASNLWELPSTDKQVAEKHKDRYLQTGLEPESLQKNLFYIYQQSNSVLEEQGYTILYLALGFLEWTEGPVSIEIKRAPLVLIPTELVRSNVRSRFKLKWTGEDIITNISLKEKLKEQSISLPDFEMPENKDGLTAYFNSVSKEISQMSKWNLYSDIYLDFFSFTKFVMWKDLDLNGWPEGISIQNFPLIRSIFQPQNDFYHSDNGFTEEEIDTKLTASTTYHVLDADPSQIVVIEDVKSGKNLVVEGPPGTGKSQTITNIIAELLIKGQSILFISEKMAALEVVKSRLDSIGLGDFCLELHSRKSKKKEVLKELYRTINMLPPKTNYNENKYHELESIKSDLNDYAKSLRETIGKTEFSVFKLYESRENAHQYFEKIGRDMPFVSFSNPESADIDQWNLARSTINNIQEILEYVKPIKSNPWKVTKPEIILESDEREINILIDTCSSLLKNLSNITEYLSDKYCTLKPKCIIEICRSLEGAKVIYNSVPIDQDVLLNPKWNEVNIKAKAIEDINKYQKLRENILIRFKPDTLDKDISSTLDEFKTESEKFIELDTSSVYSSVRKNLTSLYINPPKEFINTMYDIDEFEKYQKEILVNFKTDILHKDFSPIISGLTTEFEKFLRHELSSRYRALRLDIAWLYKDSNERAQTVTNDLDKFQKLQEQILTKYNSYSAIDFREIFDKDIPSVLNEFNVESEKFLKYDPSSKYHTLRLNIANLFKETSDRTIQSIQDIEKHQKSLLSILDKFKPSALTHDISSVLDEFETETQQLLGSDPSSRYRTLRIEIAHLYKDDNERVCTVTDNLNEFQKLQEEILVKFNTYVFEKDIPYILSEFTVESKKLFKFLRSNYRSLRSEITTMYKNSPPTENSLIISDLQNISELLSQRNQIKNRLINENSEIISDLHNIVQLMNQHEQLKNLLITENSLIISDLQNISELLSQRNQIREFNNSGISFFGSLWECEDSDVQKLIDFSDWMLSYRKHLAAGTITERSAEVVSLGIKKDDLEKQTTIIEKDILDLKTSFYELLNKINAEYESIFNMDLANINLSDISSLLDKWKSELKGLRLWSQYIDRRNNLKNTIAEPIIKLIENDDIFADDLIHCFDGNFANNLLNIAIKRNPILSRFIGELHDKKIKNFAELDQEIIRNNRTRVKNLLYQMKPSVSGGATRRSEAGILNGEINRKRGHMPIRKLLIYCGRLIQKIKPCFMMSPISIAQFLDPANTSFDVIIFDEASQVKPEDAIGSLLRGNQLIVMGDRKQLPPTSFFDRMIDSSDEENEEDNTANVPDMESILHLCSTSFPTKNLKWHYRSRHESLIAVSNQEFYDNKLLIYPSPINDPEYLGLKLVHMPHSVYDRGRSKSNRIEAEAVARAAVEHYRNFPNKSLGIGTFNVSQQEAIQEEIELQLKKNPDMEEYFMQNKEEHFFVKNLETIQGDERDVIFLSIGYGRDSYGKPSQNFGPLNHEEGYRRLNVLITRARERCVVFTNFKAGDLKVDENSSLGLKALKTFLEYAENRRLISTYPTGEDTESPFEDSVYEYLRSQGYQVDKQIGCAGFRVDLGIIDPKRPGYYMLGIECDGAKYHSSVTARDRDRLRQQILEGMGWNIYRIWSTDWYHNRKDCCNKLSELVKKVEHEHSDYMKPKENKVISKHIPNYENSNKTDNFDKEENVITDFESTNDSNSPELRSELEVDIPIYATCISLGIPIKGHIHELDTTQLSYAINRVVAVEGPVHIDEVVRRIRLLWGLGRSGHRIQQAIYKAAKLSNKNEHLSIRGKFLWPLNMEAPEVRRRIDDPQPNIDLICKEEIAEAVQLVLKYQHATMIEDLVIQTSRLLGFQATRAETYAKIKKVVNLLLDNRKIIQRQNGMIDLAN